MNARGCMCLSSTLVMCVACSTSILNPFIWSFQCTALAKMELLKMLYSIYTLNVVVVVGGGGGANSSSVPSSFHVLAMSQPPQPCCSLLKTTSQPSSSSLSLSPCQWNSVIILELHEAHEAHVPRANINVK